MDWTVGPLYWTKNHPSSPVSQGYHLLANWDIPLSRVHCSVQRKWFCSLIQIFDWAQLMFCMISRFLSKNKLQADEIHLLSCCYLWIRSVRYSDIDVYRSLHLLPRTRLLNTTERFDALLYGSRHGSLTVDIPGRACCFLASVMMAIVIPTMHWKISLRLPFLNI